jgi:hypothetical protein
MNVSFIRNACYLESMGEAARSLYRETIEIKACLFENFPKN